MGVNIGHGLLVSVKGGLDLLCFVSEAVSGSSEVGEGLCNIRSEKDKLCCNRMREVGSQILCHSRRDTVYNTQVGMLAVSEGKRKGEHECMELR